MADRVRLHMKFGWLSWSVIIEPINLFIYPGKKPKTYILGYTDQGYPHMYNMARITRTSVPPPLPERPTEATPSNVIRPGWTAYE